MAFVVSDFAPAAKRVLILLVLVVVLVLGFFAGNSRTRTTTMRNHSFSRKKDFAIFAARTDNFRRWTNSSEFRHLA